MIAVGRVYPNAMVVYVFVDFSKIGNRFSTIGRNFVISIRDVNFIDVYGVAHDLLIIISGSEKRISFLPTGTLVRRAINASLVILGFYNGVQYIRIYRADGEAHSSHISRRKSTFQFFPVRSPIRRFIDGRFRPSAYVGKDFSHALVEGGVENFWISWVHDQIIATRISAD